MALNRIATQLARREVTTEHGLAPVIDGNSRVLILGTLPGAESIRQQRYYSDRRNQFWRLLGSAFGRSVGGTYPERLAFLSTHGIALWDVLRSAERVGSSDAAIAQPEPNAFGELFERFPSLRRVAFNGTKAQSLWLTHIIPQRDVPHASLITKTLPSSSGSRGRHVVAFEEKVTRWSAFLQDQP